ncbi:hypothetical protein ACIOGX_05010 [Streptomyces sp. NPDC088147]|uniref:hypothetical protein n=1 Tax=unclassified Streptomyces TaxID=2593676 RepID=UPI00381E9778
MRVSNGELGTVVSKGDRSMRKTAKSDSTSRPKPTTIKIRRLDRRETTGDSNSTGS